MRIRSGASTKLMEDIQGKSKHQHSMAKIKLNTWSWIKNSREELNQ